MNQFIIPQRQAVSLSEKAIKHFDTIAKNKVVKFGIEGGGCAGFQYKWQILDSADDLYGDDEVIELENFVFAVDGASLMFLIGSAVDYVSDITGSHIEVVNPQASAGCGCGISVNFQV
jgi:iron-sulfur cluster assembly accessory protein